MAGCPDAMVGEFSVVAILRASLAHHLVTICLPFTGAGEGTEQED
jgi:hypothetical protein